MFSVVPNGHGTRSIIPDIISDIINPLRRTQRPDKRLFFLDGPAGVGKTTIATRRLLQLLQNGIPAESILVWVPQRMLGKPYSDALWELDLPGGQVEVSTVGGLAQRMLALFWPLVAEKAGFAHPTRPPIFLTLETTQYYMARIVAPYVDQGLFDGLSIRRNRLCSQIIDNLNKAAVIGLAHTQVAERLKAAWGGESAQKRVYDLAQSCANGFRQYCLAHNLLDFSLQIEVFFAHLLAEPLCRTYLFGSYRHLIVDNIEEDTPRAHDLLKQWLKECETALIVMDREAGYRAFLGADAHGAAELRWLCQDWLTLEQPQEIDPTAANLVMISPSVRALGWHLVRSLGTQVSAELLPSSPDAGPPKEVSPTDAMQFNYVSFQPQMLTWVADEVASLVHEQGVPPEEIAILAPFLGDALRFSLSNALQERHVPSRSHRPSRALVDEPAARCLLTLACFAYAVEPAVKYTATANLASRWQHCPSHADVAQALMVAIDGLDLVRARLLTDIVYRSQEGRPYLSSFEQIRPDVQQRISFWAGERFEQLRRWLSKQDAQPPELDDFIARLFQDMLSRPGFGFYRNLDAGRVTENMIESIRKFRQAVADTLSDEAGQMTGGASPSGNTPLSGGTPPPGGTPPAVLNQLVYEYINMVEQKVIAATYVTSWEAETAGAVLMVPAYTFLMSNRSVDVQFWLDIGSGGWWERLNQPLTHPYVLSRHWPEGKIWGDDDEFAVRQMALGRLILGLTRRCRKKIYLGIADLSEQGYEQRGPLLQAVQRMLRRMSNAAVETA